MGVGHISRFDTSPEEVKDRLAAMSEHDELGMLRDAIQVANLVVILTDPNLPDNPIVYVNQGFEKLTGYSRDEVLGRNCRFLQGDDREQEGIRHLREAIKARLDVRVELRNYRKDGSMFWNEVYVTPILAGNGLKFLLGVQNDVTNKRRLERETLDVGAREQHRIASELHDSVQQQLVGTAMYARQLAKSLAESGSEHAKQAEQLYAMMQEGVGDLRRVVQGIAPVQANENGLKVALERLAARVSDFYGVPCTFACEAPVQLVNLELLSQLYYIAQEATTNALKHAQASAIRICLVRTNSHITLTVSDDGKGFTQAQGGDPESDGLGLRLMAYRARLVGAWLEVTSEVGRGTTVTCAFEMA
jgi:PAS domain S-box-containing protein